MLCPSLCTAPIGVSLKDSCRGAALEATPSKSSALHKAQICESHETVRPSLAPCLKIPGRPGITRLLVSCYNWRYSFSNLERISSKVSMRFFHSSKPGLRDLINARIFLRSALLNSSSTLSLSLQSAIRSGSSRSGTG